MKKSNALINRCHYFPSKKNSNTDSNTESVKKTFAEISQRMFSEIMPAFTEMTEMFIMKTKNSEKRALLMFSMKCSRGALSIVDKIENWKNTKKKTTSVDEKEKDEVKLYATLVLNITFWAIYEPRRDTERSGCGKGFNDRVSLIIFLCQKPGEKNPFVSKQN